MKITISNKLLVSIFVFAVLFFLLSSNYPVKADTGLQGLGDLCKPQIAQTGKTPKVDIHINNRAGNSVQAKTFTKPAVFEAVRGFWGPNIWIGYPQGWNIPGYIQGQGYWSETIYVFCDPKGADADLTLWIYTSDNVAQLRYLFPFATMKYNCDSSGNHCGNHSWYQIPFSVGTEWVDNLNKLAGFKK